MVVTCGQVTSAGHHRTARRAIPAPALSRADLRPGDPTSCSSPDGHVSMDTGTGQTVHASTPAQPVEVVSVDSMSGVVAVRRIA